MPLFIKEKAVCDFENLEEFWAKYGDDLKPTAQKFLDQQPHCKSQHLLYVFQREYATVDLAHGVVKTIGTDQATTCHMIVLHCPSTGIVSLAHIDGTKVPVGVKGMIDDIKTLMPSFPTLDLYMVGGFHDERRISSENSMMLLREFMKQDIDINLQLACVSELNDVVKEENHWPKVYGIGVQLQGLSISVYPAKFPTRLPETNLRGARLSMDRTMRRVYDQTKGVLTLGPYTWFANILKSEDASRNLTDGEIRRKFSTSPLVEEPEFPQMLRDSYKYLADNVMLTSTGKMPLVYEMNGNGDWILRTNLSQ
ncbi:protein N-terminal asparagine amidohydrolase [Amia ocellicauda]|uniref:protein N-terminal asparagine amidohydrolase n=1 Tax=Amia ocellicauda TaxID=2972642 RepID=UPI0034642E2B|nr:NTAN1 amidohydrolase [Amia calva]